MSSNVGDRTEGALLGALVREGCTVLVPFGQHHPYDLVVDRGDGGFVRIQCKTGWERNGGIEFNSSSTDHGRGHQHYRGRADLFGIFVPSLDELFLMPVELAASRRTYLRLTATANNQALRVRYAEDFRFERYVGRLRPVASLRAV